jgi:hypothetical protein
MQAAPAAEPRAIQTFVQVPPAGYVDVTTGYTGPNRALVGTGLVTFTFAYIPAVVVAAESSLPADHHLYIPVAGPWVDLGNRPPCNVSHINCDTEAANRVLLAVDGAFQGIGVLTVFAGFLVPEHGATTAVTATTDKPSIHFGPTRMGTGGLGAIAYGSF